MPETVNRKRSAPDYALILIVICLVCLGLFMVFDASYAKAGQMKYTGNDIYFYLKRQSLWALLGVGALCFGMSTPYWKLRRWAVPAVAASLVLLAIVLIPGVGVAFSGGRRWLGRSPLLVQPSEFAKLAIILYLAHVGAMRGPKIRHLQRGLAPRLVILGLVAALIAVEPDLGTALVLAATGYALLLAAGARVDHLAVVCVCLAGLAWLAVLHKDYRAHRIEAYFDPWGHYGGAGYQVSHSLLAIGSGGWLGAGPGKGLQKFYYLPAEKTDFIFSTVGEEFGLLGGVIMVALFLLFVYRGYCIAHRTRDPFGALLAVGISSMIGIQAALNIAVTTNTVPATGVPLPFISFGGSSLFITLFAVGVLLNVSRYPNAVGQERDEDHRFRRRYGRPHLPGPEHRRGTSTPRSRGALRWQ
ncbi:MAG TPA: putative lipid II flippase FtsW [Armatimonadota bacterium]|jgi:cell division protein FtsW